MSLNSPKYICGPCICIYECWENSATKNFHPVRRPTIDSNLNHRVVEHRDKYDLISGFNYGFRSSRSSLDFLTVVSNIKLLRHLIGLSIDIYLWHFIYLRASIGFGILVFFRNLYLTEFQVSYLSLFCNNWLWLDLDGKAS